MRSTINYIKCPSKLLRAQLVIFICQIFPKLTDETQRCESCCKWFRRFSHPPFAVPSLLSSFFSLPLSFHQVLSVWFHKPSPDPVVPLLVKEPEQEDTALCSLMSRQDRLFVELSVLIGYKWAGISENDFDF